MPRVLIIVLSYNGEAVTLECLASLACIDRGSADVLVVDNASTDATVARVRERFPEVELIALDENVGYAAGNNVGLRCALERGYDYALLLNNDTEVAPDFVTRLVEVCERERDIGVAGPKIYLYDRPKVIYTAGGAIDWQAGSTTTVGLGEEDRGQYGVQRDVDFINGCAIMVRCAAIDQAGLIDVRFGMYFEETEWCVRIGRAGWRLTYVPTSIVLHKIQLERHEHSARVTYYMARNRLLFLRLTNAPASAWLNAMVAQDLRTWMSWRIKPKWRGRRAQRIAIQRGWRDFLRGRFGMVEV